MESVEPKLETVIAFQRAEIERLRSQVHDLEDRQLRLLALVADYEVEKLNLCQAVADQSALVHQLREELAARA